VAVSLLSLAFTFWSINPFLKSPTRPGNYHSNIFFGDVAAHEKPEGYLAAAEKWDEAALEKDLAFQAHALATGLKDKFRFLKLAVRCILFAQLPALGGVVLILFGTLIAEAVGKVAGP